MLPTIQITNNSVLSIYSRSGPEAKETSKFILMFDKFFDVLNVRSFVEGIKSRKPFLNPYRHGDDKRIDVSTIPIANKKHHFT